MLKYYLSFVSNNHDDDVQEFLLTAAAIGMLFKRGASISAAEVGCQGKTPPPYRRPTAAIACRCGCVCLPRRLPSPPSPPPLTPSRLACAIVAAGEVGVACSMAAAALTAVMGGTVAQVENAAEIGMEHNLGKHRTAAVP